MPDGVAAIGSRPFGLSPALSTPGRNASSAAAPAASTPQAGPPGPRGLGLALLGGLLAVGVALVSTSSAGGGGHAPFSSTAVTTEPFRLVAPALRLRMRALAECLRPEPLLAPLELPG